MVDWATAVPTVLGGAVSGIIGLLAVGYRNRQRRLEERKQWYNRVERLAQRIQRVNYGSWSGPKPAIARNTCAGVHAELASHVAEAHPSVDESFLGKCESLIAECQKVKMIEGKNYVEISSTEAEKRVNGAAQYAKQIENEASKKRQSVGLR